MRGTVCRCFGPLLSIPAKPALVDCPHVHPAQGDVAQFPVGKAVKLGHRPCVLAPGGPGSTQAAQQGTLLRQPPAQVREEFRLEIRERVSFVE